MARTHQDRAFCSDWPWPSAVTHTNRVQLLKLGVVEGLPELSEFYVIWDMDMIATRRLPILFGPKMTVDSGRVSLGFPAAGPPPARTRVNIGGAWPVGYKLAYLSLFGEECGSLNDPQEHDFGNVL